MISFQYVTYAMLVPSTILTALLVYVVSKKSPATMSRYKYVVIGTSLSVYQFDFIDGFCLCPNIVPKVAGIEFHGLLGVLFSKEGNRLFTLFVCSIMLTGFSLVFSFVWREFSLLKFKVTPLNIILHLLHFILVAVTLSGFFPIMNRMFFDTSDYTKFMDVVQAPYNPSYAVFLGLPESMIYFRDFGIYAFVLTVVCASLITKSIHRIRREINQPREYLSQTTVRIHRMLLKSLILQVAAPIVLFIIPMCIAVASAFNTYWDKFFSPDSVAAFNTQLASIVIAIPSLFTTVHVSTVLYFTTPYREYINTLLPWKHDVSQLTPHQEHHRHSNHRAKSRRHTEISKQDIRIVIS